MHTFKALSCVFGFLLPMRFFSERIASFGWTVFERITSEISRFSAMSSLQASYQSRHVRRDQLHVACPLLQATARRLLDLLVQRRIG
jgi:hypothetical protein